jgi:hypothetical protein
MDPRTANIPEAATENNSVEMLPHFNALTALLIIERQCEERADGWCAVKCHPSHTVQPPRRAKQLALVTQPTVSNLIGLNSIEVTTTVIE